MAGLLTHYPREPEGWRFDASRQYEQPGNAGKPAGLWLSDESPGGFGWKEWCAMESFAWDFTGGVEFAVDWSRVLVVKAGDDLLREKNIWEMPNPYDYRSPWNDVAAKWSGVYMRPHTDIPYWPRPLWTLSWDCDSACVWDLSCLRPLQHHAIQQGESA